MTPIRTLVAIALCLPAFAQNGLIRRGTVTDSSTPGGVNYTYTYETRLEPPTPEINGLGGGAWTGSGKMHRIVMDHSRNVYFGYDLAVETLPQKNTYRVTFRPLSVGLEKFGMDGAGWSKVLLPGYPDPQTVRVGDTIALDLLTNPTTGQKIVEHIQFQDTMPQVHVAAVSGSARDFTVTDAEFKLMEPRVIVNGAVLPPTVNFKGGISGAAAWIYIPNHGRYVLSLVPHPDLGLQKAGEIRGTSLSFSIGSDNIALECGADIAPGRAPYNLYVRHDAGWLPKGENARNSFLMGSSDSISSILQR